ncbi:MAG: hypothetical protein H6736_06005 [Alphaproteobacteria bacterium]|nr:hypothetical protein [Alphaproteobacteria bacterium]
MLLLALPGCLYAENRHLERARELCHPAWGCEEAPWWEDADGDGFGDPASEPVIAVDRPDGAANNALDCDDGRATVTGRVQTLCPADFLPDDADVRTDRGLETLLGTAPTRALDAHSVCGPVGWGGGLGAPSPIDVWTDLDVWVALDPSEIPEAWADLPGHDGLVEGQPVARVGGALVSGSWWESLAFFCSRQAPDPADWYTRTP